MTRSGPKEKFFNAAFVAAVATIPLFNNWNSIAVIVFVGACVIQRPFAQLSASLLRSRFWIVMVLYYLWLISSYFWDSSGGYTVKDLERYSILLFVPPAMACIPQISPKALKTALMVFAAVTVLVCIICLIKSYSDYLETNDYRYFYYHYLSEQMDLNAIFLSNFCLASIMWILYYSTIERSWKPLMTVFMVLVAGFLFLMIFLLSSKLIIALTLAMLIIFFLGLGYKRGFFLKSLLVATLVLVCGFFAVKNLSYLNYRVNVTELKMYSCEQDDQNGIAIRLFMWKIALDHIKERPALGYGIRGAKLETLAKYKEEGFELGVTGNYHSHNEYLESALMAGMPAVVLLLIFVIAAMRNAIVKKNLLLLLMVSHFVIQSLFESTFEVQHELVFYIFFIFLFYYHAPRLERISINK